MYEKISTVVNKLLENYPDIYVAATDIAHLRFPNNRMAKAGYAVAGTAALDGTGSLEKDVGAADVMLAGDLIPDHKSVFEYMTLNWDAILALTLAGGAIGLASNLKDDPTRPNNRPKGEIELNILAGVLTAIGMVAYVHGTRI